MGHNIPVCGLRRGKLDYYRCLRLFASGDACHHVDFWFGIYVWWALTFFDGFRVRWSLHACMWENVLRCDDDWDFIVQGVLSSPLAFRHESASATWHFLSKQWNMSNANAYSPRTHLSHLLKVSAMVEIHKSASWTLQNTKRVLINKGQKAVRSIRMSNSPRG